MLQKVKTIFIILCHYFPFWCQIIKEGKFSLSIMYKAYFRSKYKIQYFDKITLFLQKEYCIFFINKQAF